MSPALTQFRDLLAQLFQTSDSDLNFGIYRVLNQERHHIEDFLDKRLEVIVKEALGAADDSQRASLQNELDALAKSATDVGMKPEDTPKWKDKKAELDALQTSQSLETEVYNGLHDFFGRYYDDGDFLARPRYKRDVYALPYNGEEVKLHWANRDQYYIKSARVLDEFGFELNGHKICFAIAPTENGDGDNNKENRQFVLATDENGAPVVAQKDSVWTVQFSFKKPDKSGDDKDILAVDAAPLLAKVPQLSFAGEEQLKTKLRSWTRRKDWDFFVHKNLEPFLKRELDFYLKNEVVALDGLLAGDADAWQKTTLAKARAMHRLGGHLIEFLGQLETLQKRLWEKQKWVTESRIVIPFEKVPPVLRAEVLNNAAQIEEWTALYGVESEAVSTENTVVWSNPPSLAWAENHRDISVDSAHFDAAWTRRLWSELSKTETLDELWNGILFNADNFAALHLMGARFKESIKCIYIDPPYNTGGDGFLYKDSYQHSSWLSMMQDRLELAKELMSDDAAIFVSIDNREQMGAKMLLGEVFDEENFVETFLWTRTYTPASLARKSRKTVEYIHCFEKEKNEQQFKGALLDNGDAPLLNAGNSLRELVFPAGCISANLPDGVYEIGQRDRVELISPVEVKSFKVVNEVTLKGEFKWQQSFLDEEIEKGTTFIIKTDRFAIRFQRVDSGIYKAPNNLLSLELNGSVGVGSNETAYAELEDMGLTDFSYPKPVSLMRQIAQFNTDSNSLILDYFAGSGTTGHAVLNLNRAQGDEGQRRFVLCEMGRYFDSVLLPRLKKAAFADKWKDGRPAAFAGRGGVASCLWSYRLESYEDALEHLAADIAEPKDQIAFPDDDEFTVRYALSMNARDGVAPLSDSLFESPFAMQMHIGGEGVDKAEPVTLDGVATFNWLLGLRVHKMWWPSEALAAVCGISPAGRAIVVVWRQLAGVDSEQADAALLAFWREDEILNDWRASHEVETVYVNGDSTRWRTATAEEKWAAEALESKFRELMFATATTQSEVF